MDKQKKTSIITLIVLALLGTAYHFVWGGSESASDNPAVLSDGEWVPDKELMSRLEIPYRLEDNEGTVIEHMGYTLSYNNDLRVPNWVAYELLESEVITAYRSREDEFTPDPLVKGRQAYDRDYVGSGYDRGHMAPSGDMKWSSQAMKECFYLTNVCPQNHNLNMGLWNDLEKQVRYEARYYKRIWVVCGPVMEGNRNGVIGRNNVKVPDAFFKALLARRKEGKYISIGFIFPNQAGKKALSSYAMTVNELEGKIGMDLFYNLDHSVQEEVESRMDPWEWRIK